MSSSQRSDLNFYCLLLQVMAGRKPVAHLVSDPVFLDRARRMCYHLARVMSYEADELFQDLCLKLLSTGVMPRPEKTPNEAAYFRWLFVIAANIVRDHFRRSGRSRRLEVPLSEILVEALYAADPGAGPELDCRLSEFEELAESLPPNTRRVIELRREGLTYEQIASALRAEGVQCTDVTVRKWFRDSLDACFDCGRRGAAGKSFKKAV